MGGGDGGIWKVWGFGVMRVKDMVWYADGAAS